MFGKLKELVDRIEHLEYQIKQLKCKHKNTTTSKVVSCRDCHKTLNFKVTKKGA